MAREQLVSPKSIWLVVLLWFVVLLLCEVLILLDNGCNSSGQTYHCRLKKVGCLLLAFYSASFTFRFELIIMLLFYVHFPRHASYKSWISRLKFDFTIEILAAKICFRTWLDLKISSAKTLAYTNHVVAHVVFILIRIINIAAGSKH